MSKIVDMDSETGAEIGDDEHIFDPELSWRTHGNICVKIINELQEDVVANQFGTTQDDPDFLSEVAIHNSVTIDAESQHTFETDIPFEYSRVKVDPLAEDNTADRKVKVVWFRRAGD